MSVLYSLRRSFASFHGTAPSTKTIFQAGPAFLAHARRVTQNRTFEQDDQIEADHESRHGTPEDTGSDDEDQVESEPESSALLNLDPKEWKVRSLARCYRHEWLKTWV